MNRFGRLLAFTPAALALLAAPAFAEKIGLVGLGFGNGNEVVAVTVDMPGDKAGIEPGDRIASVNGQSVATPEQIWTEIRRVLLGGIVRIRVVRDGVARDVDLVKVEAPAHRKIDAARIAAPASGFAALEPNTTVTGDFRQPEPVLARGDRRCFTLTTQPGVLYHVTVWQSGLNKVYLDPEIRPEDLCEGRTTLSESVMKRGRDTTDNKSSLSFVAGGGPYTVWIDKGGRAFRDYNIAVTTGARVKDEQAPNRENAAILAATEARRRAYTAESRADSASTMSAPTPVRRVAGTVFRDCSDGCPEMVAVRAGSFLMGSNSGEMDRNSNEGPQHRVTFARSFAVGKYEVTGEEWDACVAAKGCAGKPLGTGRAPAQVTWGDARAFADWLTEKTGQLYALLSEAEWEYAARAGTDTPWNTGDGIITDDANIMDQFKQVVKVGGFPANGFGLHDVHGNAGEWVIDCSDVGYFGVPNDGGAAVTPNCPARVWRGGTFAGMPREVRSAWRGSAKPDARYGFRIGRVL